VKCWWDWQAVHDTYTPATARTFCRRLTCGSAHPARSPVTSQALRDKSNELEIKIDKEINALKAAVELTKNETIK
jgi:hypothetical protein